MNNKSLKTVKIALLIISFALGVVFYLMNGDDNRMVSTLLTWAYILVGVSAVCAIILPMMFRSGRGGKKTLVEVIIFVALLVVSYLVASGSEVELPGGQVNPSHGVLKRTDTLLILSAILLAGAILAALFGGLYKGKGQKLNK